MSVHRSAVFGDVDGAFAAADLVLDETFYQQRQTALPLELRGCVASYDGDRLSVWSSTQNSAPAAHAARLRFAHARRRHPGHCARRGRRVRREVPAAPRRGLGGRAGKTLGTACQVDRGHVGAPGLSYSSRDKQVRMQMAVQRDGTILALRADITVDVGSAQAYPYSYGSTLVLAGGMPLALKTHNYAYDYRCVVTNKAPSGAYRGFGNPMRVFVIERSMDLIAERLGLDRMDVRRRNLVSWLTCRIARRRVFESVQGPSSRPSNSAFKMLAIVIFPSASRRLGLAAGMSAWGSPPSLRPPCPVTGEWWGAFSAGDPATVRIEPDGSVTALVGTAAQGQGHRTAFAQVLADALHVMPDRVTVQAGDTAVSPYGLGAWGSRSMVVAGGAMILAAEKIRAKLLAIGAHLRVGPPPRFVSMRRASPTAKPAGC